MASIIAFVPALHSGYVAFFKKYPDTLYLLDADFVADFPRLERDIRQLDSGDMKKAIEALGIFKKVEIIHRDAVKDAHIDGALVMPDEDVSRELKDIYFQNLQVAFEPIFLRWNKQITLQENIISPDRIISTDAFDREMMAVAFEESSKSSDWWRQIGALAVRDGKIVLSGYNKHLPTDMSMDVYGDPRTAFDAGIRFDLSSAIHGESALVAQAAKKGISLEGSSLYVTTFPCPVCAKLVAEAGIKKVFYSKGYSLLDAENILKGYNVELVLVGDK